MPLQPQQIQKVSQLKIKQYQIKEPPRFTATPFMIQIYKAHSIEYKSNTSPAEVWARMQIFQKMNGFIANYYVDKVCIWNVYPNCEKNIRVVLCEENKQTQVAAIKLIKQLMTDYKIPQSRVLVQFKDKEFIQLLTTLLQDLIIEESIEILTKENDETLYSEIKIEPKIKAEFCVKGQWGTYQIGTPISAVKFKSTIGNLHYRVFIDKSWTPWASNGESCGATTGKIVGLQLQYESEEYNLKYRCSLIEKGWLPWKEKTLNIPYGKNIDGIDFKLEVK